MKIPSILRCCLVAIAFVCLYSCSSDMEESALPPASTVRPIPVTLHATLTPFDAPRQAPAARATALSWKEGDIIYLQYTAANGGSANGTLTYTGGKWSISYEKPLKRDVATKCVAYYFDGTASASGSVVTLSATTGIYADTNSSYSYPTGGDLAITCNLQPQTSRIRFKGASGTSFTLAGMSCGSSFNPANATVSKSTTGTTVTIQSDGYSPYIYGHFASADQPQLVIEHGGDTFTADCTGRNMLATGATGRMTLPTASHHSGWAMEGEIDPGDSGSGNTGSENDDHEWVDLGLPSGLKWATMNVGATSPEDYGDYFAWGETEPKGYYYWSTYKWCSNGKWTGMTKYTYPDGQKDGIWYNNNTFVGDNKTTLAPEDDAAHVNWGGGWRMPTKAEQDELRRKCTWTWATQNGVKGYKVVGPNGNSLFLPAAGYRGEGYLDGAGSNGDYWSSSLDTSDSNYAYGLDFDSDRVDWSYSHRRYYGLSVRAVCP